MPVLSQDLDFQHHMSWHFFVLNDLRKEVVFCFVVIGRIIEHPVVKNSKKKEKKKKKNLKNEYLQFKWMKINYVDLQNDFFVIKSIYRNTNLHMV